MATYYWVGGSGTWDTSNGANWSLTSGGLGGAGVPTQLDDVIFDAGSDVGTPFTVTIADNPTCKSFSTGGSGGALDQAMTVTGAAALSPRLFLYGSLTLPAVNLSVTGTTFWTFQDSATITTNGVTIGQVTIVNGIKPFNPNLTVSLGSALTSSGLSINSGTFSTNNFAVTAPSFNPGLGNAPSALPRTINLGSSTVTLSGSAPIVVVAGVENVLAFNAGTSSIICTAAGVTFNGAGLTYNDVSFTNANIGTVTINGSNTFNNLTFTPRTTGGIATVQIPSGITTTVNGTLALGTAPSAIQRLFFRSTGFRQQATISVAAAAAFSDADFRDIVVTGAAAPLSGTRVGNLGNNSGVTFTAGATKYWNLVGGGNWTNTAWALTSGGAPAVNNYPLAQDTVVISDTGLNSGATITFNLGAFVGNLDMSGRTLPMTLATGAFSPQFYSSITLSSAVTMTGTTGTLAIIYVSGTQNVNLAGVTIPKAINVAPIGGTITFTSAFTVNGTATFGTAPPVATGTVRFTNGTTNTATSFVIQNVTLNSTTPGSQYTLSQASGTVTATKTSIQDSNATGGATWQAPLYYENVDGGNNTGWAFTSYSPISRGSMPAVRFGFKL